MKKFLCFVLVLFVFYSFNVFAEIQSFLMGTEYIMNDKKGPAEFDNSYFIGYEYDNFLCAWSYNFFKAGEEKLQVKYFPKNYWNKESFTLKFPESFRKKYGYSKEINDRFIVSVWNDPKSIVKEIKNSKGYYLCDRAYPRYKQIELAENHDADCMADLKPQRVSYAGPVKCVFLEEEHPVIKALIGE